MFPQHCEKHLPHCKDTSSQPTLPHPQDTTYQPTVSHPDDSTSPPMVPQPEDAILQPTVPHPADTSCQPTIPYPEDTISQQSMPHPENTILATTFSETKLQSVCDSSDDSSDESVLDPTYAYRPDDLYSDFDSEPEIQNISGSTDCQPDSSISFSAPRHLASSENPQSKGTERYNKPSRTCPFCSKACGEKLSRHILSVHKKEKKSEGDHEASTKGKDGSFG